MSVALPPNGAPFQRNRSDQGQNQQSLATKIPTCSQKSGGHCNRLLERNALWTVPPRSGHRKSGKLSIVGVGIKSRTGVTVNSLGDLLGKALTLTRSPGEIKISAVIDLVKSEQAMNTVHAAFVG
ncbi:MAG TPA: hypothetical protein VFB55_04310 [Verrucomicrobiae bacterium]|nr:hypothetical protein [Verrucomicrobiae bacterium]